VQSAHAGERSAAAGLGDVTSFQVGSRARPDLPALLPRRDLC